VGVEPRLDDVVAIDGALMRLEALNARLARVVECRFFAGMNIDETADALDISSATVKRDWAVARAWLNKELLER
jgi:RNA polymerase sigma-70 factor, ECF subfamily